jgi:cyclin-dependent kinase regulatory subunit CKS1
LKFFWRLPPSRPRADDRDPRPLQSEWRGLGVQQSRGWVHYAIHRPEPHIMLYRCERRSPPPSPSKRRRLFALRARARARFPSASRARDRARGGVPARTNPADRSIGGFFIATRRGVETGATRRASTARVPPHGAIRSRSDDRPFRSVLDSQATSQLRPARADGRGEQGEPAVSISRRARGGRRGALRRALGWA